MPEIWDAEWTAADIAPVDEGSEHWTRIRLHLPNNAAVLEAGCGVAKWVAFLSSKGHRAIGVDYSPVAIDRSRQVWPHIELARADLRRMPFEDDVFDLVLSLGAVEHDEAGPEAALREMLRVLQPGGILYCTVPCMNSVRRWGYMRLQDWLVTNKVVRRLFGRQPESAFFEYVFTSAEFSATLERCGLSVLEVVPLSPMALPYGLGGRIIARSWRRWPWATCHMMAGICVKEPAR
jgi:SAM-dependent methyltransferase